jgi:hypothetical protein
MHFYTAGEKSVADSVQELLRRNACFKLRRRDRDSVHIFCHALFWRIIYLISFNYCMLVHAQGLRKELHVFKPSDHLIKGKSRRLRNTHKKGPRLSISTAAARGDGKEWCPPWTNCLGMSNWDHVFTRLCKESFSQRVLLQTAKNPTRLTSSCIHHDLTWSLTRPLN